jgi:hypothetical protein
MSIIDSPIFGQSLSGKPRKVAPRVNFVLDEDSMMVDEEPIA